MRHIIKPALELFIVAAVTTTLLILTHALTLGPIENQHRIAQEKLMSEILQATVFNEIPAEKSGTINRVFEALNNDVVIGYIVELAPKGYDDTISMIVGISKQDNVITGMRVLKHSETPGLGAIAATEKFYRKFEGRRLIPLKVVRSSPREDEIDAITSATITTRAITNAVNEAIEWYQKKELHLESHLLEAEIEIMREVLHAAIYREIPSVKSGNIDRIFEAINENEDELVGYVFELSPSGYAGKINIIVGISRIDDAVSGMRVIKHHETIGRGALAVREEFYRKFDGRKLVPLTVVKGSPGENEIDAISRATITTRAITNAVNEAIEWYQGRDLK